MVAVALALVLLAAAPPASGGPLHVVTTTTDLQSLVQTVGGDRVHVTSLAPATHPPHQVEIKPGQLAELRTASLLVRVGLDHEPWLWRVLRTVNDPRLQAGGANDLDLSRGVALLQTETSRVRPSREAHVHGFGNTHYWLDPANARPMTEAILQALIMRDPAGRAELEERRRRFLADLDAHLARWTATTARYRGTRAVVVHETWPYFAERFGLVIVAALEPTPGVPPPAAYLASLVEHMKEARVGLLIAEPGSDAGPVQQVAARTGARVVTLIPSVGGDPAARDYLSLFDVNVTRLTEALRSAR